jgi:hypothetical protein
MYPIQYSDRLTINGVENSSDLATWIDSWLQDPDLKEMRIEKVGDLADFRPSQYLLAPLFHQKQKLIEFINGLDNSDNRLNQLEDFVVNHLGDL